MEGFKAASSGSVTDFQGGLQGELLMIAGQQDIVAPVVASLYVSQSIVFAVFISILVTLFGLNSSDFFISVMGSY